MVLATWHMEINTVSRPLFFRITKDLIHNIIFCETFGLDMADDLISLLSWAKYFFKGNKYFLLIVEERSPTLAFEACKIEEATILWQINSVGSTMQHKGRKDPLDFQISVTLSLPKSYNKTFSFLMISLGIY